MGVLAKIVFGLSLMFAAPGLAQAQQAPPSAQAPANAQAPATAGTLPEQAPQMLGPGSIAATPSASADYLLGPEDVVDVDVLGRPDFKTRARIGADGTIQLPLIGRIPASDRTSRKLEEEIARSLQSGGYFSNPIVNIEVASFASRYVTVLGAVGTPGLLPVNRRYRLSEVLAKVGGVRDNGADYVILRRQDGPEQRLLVKSLATGDLSQDPFVEPGDKIFSPVADLFYISGQVVAPGAYPLPSDLTVRMAIARGGGLTPSGSDRRVNVTRAGTKQKLELSDKVQAGDVIVVGERLF